MKKFHKLEAIQTASLTNHTYPTPVRLKQEPVAAMYMYFFPCV